MSEQPARGGTGCWTTTDGEAWQDFLDRTAERTQAKVMRDIAVLTQSKPEDFSLSDPFAMVRLVTKAYQNGFDAGRREERRQVMERGVRAAERTNAVKRVKREEEDRA